MWLDICKLMRIRIRFRIQLINVDADPDADPQHCKKLQCIPLDYRRGQELRTGHPFWSHCAPNMDPQAAQVIFFHPVFYKYSRAPLAFE
jgi:hypothetical protein